MAISDQFDLPEDVLIHLLSLLPVKSLMRFKCACKSWRLLFEDTRFIAKHLNNDGNGEFFFVHSQKKVNAFSLLSNEALNTIDDANLDFPNSYQFDLNLAGCCNGILCVTYTLGIDTVLWNPATREIKILPKFNHPRPDHFNADELGFHMGFGFDSKTNNYKVFNIRYDSSTYRGQFLKQIEVYDLSTDSWSKCDALMPFNYLCYLGSPNPYLKGVFSHMAVDESCVQMIVSFDISQEIFIVTPVPDVCVVRTNMHYWRKLTVLNEEESIALILSLNPDKGIYDGYEVWMLKEYGVKESWTKLYTFQQLSYAQFMRPIGYWKNNHYFMETPTGKLVLWNPVTQEINDLQIDNVWFSTIFFYKESLISLNGFSVSSF